LRCDSVPRKAPDKVVEHRISFGTYERTRIDELISLHRKTSIANSTSNFLGGITLPVLGLAALLYVGFSLEDLVENVKKWTDKTSTGISNYLVENEIVVYTAPAIGEAINRNNIQKADLYAEWQRRMQSGEIKYSSSASDTYKSKIESLEKKDIVLRRMLDKIATGKADEYSYIDPFDNWSILGGYEQDDEAVDTMLQEFYEDEGGSGTYN